MKKMRTILGILLSLAMTATMLPTAVFAETSTPVENPTSQGEQVTDEPIEDETTTTPPDGDSDLETDPEPDADLDDDDEKDKEGEDETEENDDKTGEETGDNENNQNPDAGSEKLPVGEANDGLSVTAANVQNEVHQIDELQVHFTQRALDAFTLNGKHNLREFHFDISKDDYINFTFPWAISSEIGGIGGVGVSKLGMTTENYFTYLEDNGYIGATSIIRWSGDKVYFDLDDLDIETTYARKDVLGVPMDYVHFWVELADPEPSVSYTKIADGYEYEACEFDDDDDGDDDDDNCTADCSGDCDHDGEDLEDGNKDNGDDDFKFNEVLYRKNGTNEFYTLKNGVYTLFEPESPIEAREDDDEPLKNYSYTGHYHIDDHQVEFHYTVKEPEPAEKITVSVYQYYGKDSDAAFDSDFTLNDSLLSDAKIREDYIKEKDGYVFASLDVWGYDPAENVEIPIPLGEDGNYNCEGYNDIRVHIAYNETTPVEWHEAQFFIRKNKNFIPFEVDGQQYPVNQYTPRDWFTGAVKEVCNISNKDLDLKDGNYNLAALQTMFEPVNKVIDQSKLPTTEDIRVHFPNYDPKNETVLWYVVKKTGDPFYHIDGVILDKALISVSLVYDPNAGDDKVTGLPDTIITAENSTVKVDDGSKMKREGYTFDGWMDAPVDGKKVTGDIELTTNTTLYASWKPVEKAPTVTVFTYYEGVLKHRSVASEYEIGEALDLAKIAPDEVEYNRHYYKLDMAGYLMEEEPEAHTRDEVNGFGSEPFKLQADNNYQIHVFYQLIPQGTLTVTHQLNVYDTKGNSVGEPIILSTKSTVEKEGTTVTAANLILGEYKDNYKRATSGNAVVDDVTVAANEVTTLTLIYEKTVPADVSSPVILHRYQTINNGQIIHEELEEIIVPSMQGNPFKDGDSIYLKDHLKNKEGFDFYSYDPQDGILVLGINDKSNIATIIYVKSVTSVTVNYIDENGGTIAESVNGEVQRGTRLDETLKLDDKPIKIDIENYTFKEAIVNENVIDMVYAKDQRSVTILYQNEAGAEISTPMEGQVDVDVAGTITDAFVLNDTPIKKSIAGYTYQRMTGPNDDFVYTMIYSQNTSGGGDDNTSGGGYIPRPRPTPTPTPTPEVIPDDETPLAPGPISPEDDVIADEVTPLAPSPADDLELIDDEETPLASAPKTGSTASRTAAALAGAALMLGGLLFSRRKEK